MPAMLLNELVIVTFYFVGGLMLLEKGEGTLQAQSVSPLLTAEYVLSKVVTLTIAAVLQVLLIVALIPGVAVRWTPLILGVTMAAIMFVLVGIIVVLRARSINEYLLPSIMYLGLLLAPMLPYAIGWSFWPMYLHPVQAPLVLMRAALEDIALWQLGYAIVAGGCWIGLFYRISLRQFRHFVVAAV
jgi:fluoroquinolone transport system permease protein